MDVSLDTRCEACSVNMKKIVFAIFLLLLVGFGCNGYHSILRKDGLFIDEICSFNNANIGILTFSDFWKAVFIPDSLQTEKIEITPTDDVCYNSDLFDKYYVGRVSKSFRYFSVYLIQSFCDSHPPLYHFLLHTVSSISKSSNLYLIGFSVNIFFLVLTCVFLYKISELITKDSYISLIVMSYYGFSYSFLNNLNLFRMYALMTCLFTVLLCLYLLVAKKNWKIERKEVVQICIVEFLLMFTQYFSLFFILPLFTIAIYSLRKNKIPLKPFIMGHAITIMVYCLVWPSFIIQLLKGLELKERLDPLSLMQRFHGSYSIIVKELFAGKRIPLLILLGAFCVVLCWCRNYCKRNSIKLVDFLQMNHLWTMLIISSVFYYVVIAVISPWVDWRYESPVMPIFVLLIVGFFYKSIQIVSKRRDVAIALSAISVFVLSFFYVPKLPVMFSYERTPQKENFIELCSKNDAIVLDAYDNRAFWDVAYNYKHPRYLRSDDTCAVDFYQKKLCADHYVLYVSRFSGIDTIIGLLHEKNYQITDLNYQTDFYNTYYLKK